METTKLKKLARLSGKAMSKALDVLGKSGFDSPWEAVRADQPNAPPGSSAEAKTASNG